MTVKEDAKLNETLRTVGAGNQMPEGETFEVRKLGRTGVRIVIDQVLSSVEGFGRDSLEVLGINLKEIAMHRQEIEDILISIVMHDGRRPNRRQARSAAIRILGYLRMKGSKNVLGTVLQAEHETPSIRAAAADALGLMRAEDSEPLLMRFVNDPHENVARAAAGALGHVGTELSVTELEKRLASAVSGALQGSLQNAIRRIEERMGIKPLRPKWRKEEREASSRTQELNIEVSAQGKLVQK